jgi:hypothetical protein
MEVTALLAIACLSLSVIAKPKARQSRFSAQGKLRKAILQFWAKD